MPSRGAFVLGRPVAATEDGDSLLSTSPSPPRARGLLRFGRDEVLAKDSVVEAEELRIAVGEIGRGGPGDGGVVPRWLIDPEPGSGESGGQRPRLSRSFARSWRLCRAGTRRCQDSQQRPKKSQIVPVNSVPSVGDAHVEESTARRGARSFSTRQEGRGRRGAAVAPAGGGVPRLATRSSQVRAVDSRARPASRASFTVRPSPVPGSG